MNNNVVLKAVGLQKSYKEGGRLLHVLKDVNLEVHEGESVAIVGTSGSGKTTLLQCIGGLDRFDKGLIEIGGENIAELSEQRLTELRNRKLGFVYQFHHLLPEFTAMENVAMPLKIRREKASVAQKRAESLLLPPCCPLGIGSDNYVFYIVSNFAKVVVFFKKIIRHYLHKVKIILAVYIQHRRVKHLDNITLAFKYVFSAF